MGMWACAAGCLPMVHSLLEWAADVNIVGGSDVPPLLLAADSGCAEIVAELVSARATIDIQDSAGRTALICASALGHQDVVAMLLEAGADPLATTKEGCSPLLHAVEYFGSECLSRPISKKSLSDKAGAIAVARLLLEARADVHASTED